MSAATRWIGGAALVATVAVAAFWVGRASAPSPTAAVTPVAERAADAVPRPPRARTEAPAPESPPVAPPVAPQVAASPVAPAAAAPAPAAATETRSLRDTLAAFEPSPSGKWSESLRAVQAAARATQRDAVRRAQMWSLLETEEDPAVLVGLVALTRNRPLSPATAADRDRAWELLLRDGPADRRRAAGALWLLGEAWGASPDRKDRILRALEGALPYELLDPVAALVEEDALARDPDVHDALVRAVDRAPPGTDVSRLTPSLSNPWVRHDPFHDLVEAWRKAEDPRKRADLAAAYASQLTGSSGGFADGPPVRGRPVESPAIRGTVEVYAGTADRDVRARIAAGLYSALRLDDAGRRAVYRELAGLEPDAALRERLLRLSDDPARVRRESGDRLDRFLRGDATSDEPAK